jgi:NADP-dependent 3-hydroxy acid dehydrogenase YdfG
MAFDCDQIDYLHVNLGIAILEPFEQVMEETYDKICNVNTKGAFFTAQVYHCLFVKVEPLSLPPRLADEGVFAGMSVYAASKAAVWSLRKKNEKVL